MRALLFAFLAFPLQAQWGFEFQGGTAWSLEGPLVIERDGKPGRLQPDPAEPGLAAKGVEPPGRCGNRGRLRLSNGAFHLLAGFGYRI